MRWAPVDTTFHALGERVRLDAANASEPAGEPASTRERASRHPWAWLLARVFAVDVTVCPHCAGRMRLVKLATTREEVRTQQAELEGRLGRLEERDATVEASAQAEHDSLEGGLTDVARRLVGLEGRAAKAAKSGEPCHAERSRFSGIDDCELGAMCWDVERVTLEGNCVPFCMGTSEEDAYCAEPDTLCEVSTRLPILLCTPVCDPLAQDCPAGEACYFFSSLWQCAPDTSGDAGAYGDPCQFIPEPPSSKVLCNPLQPDCLEGQGCYPVQDSWLCALDASGELGAYGG
jgi:hypothetical protein